MQKAKVNNQIYLSGGGNEHQSFPLDNFFFNALPKKGFFLYIPIALRGHKLFSTAPAWMKGLITLHKRRDLTFKTVINLQKYKFENLVNINGIYIGGGNTWLLMQELKDSRFADVLNQYLKTGVLLYGGSAGAIVFGKKIDTQNDKNVVRLKDQNGLNLLNKYSIICHYTKVQDDNCKKWTKKNKLPLICLPEETGLIIEADQARCVGTKPCMLYSATGKQKLIKPNKSFNL